MFEQRLGTALLSPGQREAIRTALKTPPSLEECLSELSGEAGRLALRDAVMMAAADGTVDEDERRPSRTSPNTWACVRMRWNNCSNGPSKATSG